MNGKAAVVGLAMVLALAGCAASGPDEATQGVIDQIDAIGTVTLDSEDAIDAASDAYAALDDEQRENVSNYDTLDEAKLELDQLKADEVSAAIASIGEVTLDSEGAISEARSAYNSLSSRQKECVEGYSDLEAAEDTLATLQEEEAARQRAFSVGDVVESDQFRVTLTSAAVTSTVSSSSSRTYWEAEDGAVFVALEFDVEALTSDQLPVDDYALTDIVANYNGNTYSGWRLSYVTSELWLYFHHTYLEANLPEHVYVYTSIPSTALDDGQPVTVDLNVAGEAKTITVR